MSFQARGPLPAAVLFPLRAREAATAMPTPAHTWPAAEDPDEAKAGQREDVQKGTNDMLAMMAKMQKEVAERTKTAQAVVQQETAKEEQEKTSETEQAEEGEDDITAKADENAEEDPDMLAYMLSNDGNTPTRSNDEEFWDEKPPEQKPNMKVDQMANTPPLEKKMKLEGGERSSEYGLHSPASTPLAAPVQHDDRDVDDVVAALSSWADGRLEHASAAAKPTPKPTPHPPTTPPPWRLNVPSGGGSSTDAAKGSDEAKGTGTSKGTGKGKAKQNEGAPRPGSGATERNELRGGRFGGWVAVDTFLKRNSDPWPRRYFQELFPRYKDGQVWVPSDGYPELNNKEFRHCVCEELRHRTGQWRFVEDVPGMAWRASFGLS